MEDDKKLPDGEDDLEDGEIESDDEPVITMVIPPEKAIRKSLSPPPPTRKGYDSDSAEAINKKSTKFKKPQVVDDDWAGNIENAIAAALKKDGIEPPLPKLDKREGHNSPRDRDEDMRKARKRKKREDKDKTKKRLKHNDDSKGQPEDIEDYEMLCIRGGSPPRSMPPEVMPPIQPSAFYDSDESYSSYGSYDSGEYRKMSYDERRHSRRTKDRRQRKFSGRQCSGAEKRRNRHDSDGGDDCQRQHDSRSQRKLELCKFYLMECCAKKEKCSYMHGDFPCKYYYLGMECVYKASCKFSHGKPLTDQLRNILLKHIETAPKEILGNFRRISREHATTLLNTTHAKLCQEHNTENTLAPPTSPSNSLITVIASQKSATAASTINDQGTVIPSLLDMNIKPPLISPRKDDKDRLNKGDKPRKSRWCDYVSTTNMAQLSGIQMQSSSIPSTLLSTAGANNTTDVLSLKNLKGVLTPDQIEKLHAIGVENLEQISQLTVAQLNNVGLTISQINEIQLNALNIQKLGLINTLNASTAVPQSSSTNLLSDVAVECATVGKSSNQDVDMRFLVGASAASVSNSDIEHTPSLSDAGIASPEPTPNSGKQGFNSQKVVMLDQHEKKETVVDYTQYLKDSNLDAESTDFNDLLIDDKEDDDVLNEDEPELLIDESWCPSDEEAVKNESSQNTVKCDGEWGEEKPMPAVYDPKSFFSPKIPTVIDISSSVSNMFSGTSRVMYDEYEVKDKSDSEMKTEDNSKDYRDPRLGYANIPGISDEKKQIAEPPKYHRTSMYDGTNDDVLSGLLDNESRLPSFVDTLNNDTDLRLPFKPVMTNYTPATEIDGSIASHCPITYKVFEIEIPKPDYNEIRSSIPVSEKTLDPRLRRLFCLKETVVTENASPDSDSILMSISSPTSKQNDIQPPTIDKTNISTGPRVDPRRRKDNQESIASNLTNRSQNVDTRILLQKSNWYKNLNSTFKIMVNQQLALLSTELKKFQQDTSPTKVFDMKFIISNQNLQQVLTNLGIYIDANGQILQLDSESDDPSNSMGMSGNMMVTMSDKAQAPVGMPPMDFMRAPMGMNMNSLYMPMGGKPFGPRFGDIRPGLLGIAPGVHPYNPFDAGNNNDGGNSFTDNDMSRGFGGGVSGGDSGGSGGGRGNHPFDQGNNFYGGRHSDSQDSRQGGNRGNRLNYNRHVSQNSRNNSGDRWNTGGGGNNMGQGGRNSGGRRNYDSRGSSGRDRDARRDKTQK